MTQDHAGTMGDHRVIVRYQVKPGREAENEELVRAVYAELAERGADGFRYATFRLDDRTFVHIASTAAGTDAPLPQLAAFRAFQAGIRDRCEWGPVVSEASEVGSYRFLELATP